MARSTPLDRFQRVALLTVAATYALVAIGGLVRASGSGLGCPDWPRCFGRWYPPLSAAGVPPTLDPALFNFAKAWTEYLNRLFGVLDGLLITATVVLACMRHRGDARIWAPAVLAFLLVGIEGALGGRVVSSGLAPVVLTLHLTLALTIISLLLYATVGAFWPAGASRPLSAEDRALGRACLAVTLVVLAQTGLGAAVRGQVQVATGPRAGWISQSALLYGHQAVAPVVAAAVLGLTSWIFRRVDRDPRLLRVSVLATSLVLLQAGSGWVLVRFALPPTVQVVHLGIGSLLLGVLTLQTLLAYRLAPAVADVVGQVR